MPLASAVAAELHIARPVAVWMAEAVESPMMTGFFRRWSNLA